MRRIGLVLGCLGDRRGDLPAACPESEGLGSLEVQGLLGACFVFSPLQSYIPDKGTGFWFTCFFYTKGGGKSDRASVLFPRHFSYK